MVLFLQISFQETLHRLFFWSLYHNVSSLYDDALFSKETIAFWSFETVFKIKSSIWRTQSTLYRNG
jgi:hypothetical protein